MTTAFCALLGAANSGAPATPGVPASLSVTAVGGYNRILVTWADGARTSTIGVQRSPDNSTWATIASVKAGVQAYQDGSRTPGTIYYYRIRGENLSGNSSYTASGNATCYDPVNDSFTLVLEASSGILKTPGGSASTAANDAIQQWTDRSGSGFNFTETTHPPHLQFVNGLPVVRFSTNQHLGNATKANWVGMHNGDPYSLFIVFRTTDSVAEVVYGLMGDNNFASGQIGTSIGWYNGTGDTPATWSQIYHMIAKGSGTNPYYNISHSGIAHPQLWHVAELEYQYNIAGNDGFIYMGGDTTAIDSAATPSASNAGYGMQIGDAGNNGFPGNVDIVAIYLTPNLVDGTSTQSKLYEYIQAKFPTLIGLPADPFLNTRRVDSYSAALLPLATMTKDTNNPIMIHGVNTDTWDYDKLFEQTLKIGATWKKWYSGQDASLNEYIYYATSTDGVNWTKPNLGLITYGGNTNNNILFVAGWYAASVVYNAGFPAGYEYIMTIQEKPGDYGLFIKKSSDGINWSDVGSGAIVHGGPASNRNESEALIYRATDQRLIAYTISGHDTSHRAVRCWINDGFNNPDSGWHDAGQRIGTTSNTDQKYTLGIHVENGVFYALVYIYNSSTEQIDRAELWVNPYAQNGMEWELVGTVLQVGAGGTWDDSMLLAGKELIDDGANHWVLSYAGSPTVHNGSQPFDARIGNASIPKGRFRGFGPNGQITTELVYIDTAQSIYINVNASGGSLKAELLDSTGTPITGYALADFDTITSDAYSTELKWGGIAAPATTAAKLHLVVLNAYCYEYHIA